MQGLRETPIFGGLSAEELAKVLSLAQEVVVDPGEEIVRRGELATEVFVVLEGTAEVLISSGEGTVGSIAVLRRGDCFGEMALLEIRPRSATVRALGRCRLLSLDHRAFGELRIWRLETYCLIVMNLAREISRRLRRADARIAEFWVAEHNDDGWSEGSIRS